MWDQRYCPETLCLALSYTLLVMTKSGYGLFSIFLPCLSHQSGSSISIQLYHKLKLSLTISLSFFGTWVRDCTRCEDFIFRPCWLLVQLTVVCWFHELNDPVVFLSLSMHGGQAHSADRIHNYLSNPPTQP